MSSSYATVGEPRHLWRRGAYLRLGGAAIALVGNALLERPLWSVAIAFAVVSIAQVELARRQRDRPAGSRYAVASATLDVVFIAVAAALTGGVRSGVGWGLAVVVPAWTAAEGERFGAGVVLGSIVAVVSLLGVAPSIPAGWVVVEAPPTWLAVPHALFVISGVGGSYVVVRLLLRKVQRDAELKAKMDASAPAQMLGQLTGGVVHDINNVLGTLRLLTDDLATYVSEDPDAREGIEHLRGACDRGRSLTRGLLAAVHRTDKKMTVLDPVRLLEDTVALLRRTLPRGVRLELEVDDDLVPVRGDEGQLSQALINLALNASQAMGGEGTIALCGRRTESADGERVTIEVRDNGPGMSPQVLRRALEPFFTTKPPSEGTGLGLSQVETIAESHGGGLRLRSTPGQGCTVSVTLPSAESHAEAARSSVGISSHRFPTAPSLTHADDRDRDTWI